MQRKQVVDSNSHTKLSKKTNKVREEDLQIHDILQHDQGADVDSITQELVDRKGMEEGKKAVKKTETIATSRQRKQVVFANSLTKMSKQTNKVREETNLYILVRLCSSSSSTRPDFTCCGGTLPGYG